MHVAGQPGGMEHERCLDIFHDNGLEYVVKGATHDLGSTLDLLVTNNPTAVNRIEILPPFSDHNPVFTEIALNAKRATQKPRVVPAYKRASWDMIKAALNALHQEILENVRTASSIDSILTLFRASYVRPSTSTSRQEPPRRSCVCHGSQRDSDGWEGVATERARGHGEMAMTRGCVP